MLSERVIQQVRRLRSGAGQRLMLSMVAAVMARLGLLALAIVIARRFGPSDYGTFTFATGLALLLGQLASLGWPMLMNRLIPQFMKGEDWPRLKGLRDAGDLVVLLSTLACVAILLAIGWLLDEVEECGLAALLLIPFAFAILRRQQLAATRAPALGLLFDQGLGAVLAVAVLLIWVDMSLAGATALFAASVMVSVLIATVIFRRRLPPQLAGVTRRAEVGPWMMIALPMMIGMSSKLLMNKTDILMLAPLSNMYEVGLYGAAFRLTYLLTFPQVVLMSVLTPMLSEAFANQDPRRVKRLARAAIVFALLTALPFALLIVLFPEKILGAFFGQEFVPAAATLIILTAGQTAASLAIPFQALLTMGGRERKFGALNVGGLLLHVLLNLALVPRYGAVGAAWATAMVAGGLLVGHAVLGRDLWAKRKLDV